MRVVEKQIRAIKSDGGGRQEKMEQLVHRPSTNSTRDTLHIKQEFTLWNSNQKLNSVSEAVVQP